MIDMNKYDWKAAILAGIIAGAVFMMLEMIMVPLFLGGSPWGPPRMIAAIIMGKEVLPPPATFALGVFIVAMIVHFILSIIYAIILAAIVRRNSKTAAVAIGAVLGLALYFINFYGFQAILFPWFAMAAVGFPSFLILYLEQLQVGYSLISGCAI